MISKTGQSLLDLCNEKGYYAIFVTFREYKHCPANNGWYMFDKDNKIYYLGRDKNIAIDNIELMKVQMCK